MVDVCNTMLLSSFSRSDRSLSPVCCADPSVYRVTCPPSPIIVNGEPLWFVEKILDVKPTGPLLYLVKWTGYDIPTWEPLKNVRHLFAFATFYEQYPHKRKPLSLRRHNRHTHKEPKVKLEFDTPIKVEPREKKIKKRAKRTKVR